MGETAHRWVKLSPWLLLVFVLISTAWVCDDAYITFRSVDHVLQGHGPVYNVGERVQAYTHPLWMWLHVPFQAVFGNVYGVTIMLSLALSLLSFRLLSRDGFGMWWTLPLMIISSKALIEYSSSGLENPLTFLLLAWFTTVWMRAGERNLLHLGLIASLIFLNRMDAILMVAPALGVAFWQQRSLKAMRSLLLALLPVLLWEAFSLTYYGFLFPNTAYAKLGTGIGNWELMQMGMAYLQDSLTRDPVTLPLIGAGMVAGFWRGGRWPQALGILLYLMYILRIGGDFMSGRFLAAPLLLSLFLLGSVLEDVPKLRLILPLLALGVSLLGPTPVVLSGVNFTLPKDQIINAHGIADERAFYYPGTGLLHALEGREMPDFRWVQEGKQLKGAKTVYQTEAIGFVGYFAGPDVHVLDRLALSDPLLARMPARFQVHPRPGHYERLVPSGYFQSIKSDSNMIEDATAAQLYADLRVITKGEISDSERWGLIWKYNFQPADLPSVAHFRIPVWDSITLPLPDTTALETRNGFGFFIRWDNPAQHLTFQAMDADHLTCVWMQNGKPVLGTELESPSLVILEIPKGIQQVAIFPKKAWPAARIYRLRVDPI